MCLIHMPPNGTAFGTAVHGCGKEKNNTLPFFLLNQLREYLKSNQY